MQTKFGSPIKGNNKGSSSRVVNYLEKENENKLETNQEYFFNADRDKCNKWEVINKIDQNAKDQGLKSTDDRFYTIIIAPSKEELSHIGNDNQKLKDYTRNVMENYASNFNKGLESKDLVWYAKVENERKHTYDSNEVKTGNTKEGQLKEGDQRHIHIIVSRCAARQDLNVIKEQKLMTNKDRTMKLSPLTNQRGESKGAVKTGFDRDSFFRKNENSFDNTYRYERPINQSYDFCNSLKNGNSKNYNQAIEQSKPLGKTTNREIDQSINKNSGYSYGQ